MLLLHRVSRDKLARQPEGRRCAGLFLRFLADAFASASSRRLLPLRRPASAGSTCMQVRLLGPCFKTGRNAQPCGSASWADCRRFASMAGGPGACSRPLHQDDSCPGLGPSAALIGDEWEARRFQQLATQQCDYCLTSLLSERGLVPGSESQTP